ELQRLQFLVVLVQRRVGKYVHPHLAVGVSLGKLLEPGGALALWRVGRDDVAELDDSRLLRGRWTDQRKDGGECNESALQVFSSLLLKKQWIHLKEKSRL